MQGEARCAHTGEAGSREPGLSVSGEGRPAGSLSGALEPRPPWLWGVGKPRPRRPPPKRGLPSRRACGSLTHLTQPTNSEAFLHPRTRARRARNALTPPSHTTAPGRPRPRSYDEMSTPGRRRGTVVAPDSGGLWGQERQEGRLETTKPRRPHLAQDLPVAWGVGVDIISQVSILRPEAADGE